MSGIHVDRLGHEVYLGKQPATPPKVGVAYSELRPALKKAGVLPTVPQMFGHGHDFRQGQWLMLGNGPDDTVTPGFGGCGNCAWAGPGHEEMAAGKNAGRPVPRFSGKTIVDQYAAYSGYDPQTGANDTGSNVQDVIQWRQTRGLLDDAGHPYKIGQAIRGTPGNVQELWEIAYLCETAGIGVILQTAQMDQFNASAQPTWDYVPGSPAEGGHYVPVMGKLGLISWADDVYYTPAFIQQQCDEVWGYIDPERYNRVTGQTAEHFTDQDLEKYLVLIAQQKLGS